MSTEPITVRVDRGSESLEATATAIETAGSFELFLEGGEIPAHVHCRLEGELASVARIDGDDPNVYVEPGTTTPVSVVVGSVETPVTGSIEVSTGYGATTLSIDVTVTPESAPQVDVDDRLRDPPRRNSEADAGTGSGPPRMIPGLERLDTETFGVVVLALIAVAVAALSAAVVGGLAAFVAFLIVTAGIVVAAALLVGWEPI